eukprot:gene5480-3954_t
MQFFIEMLLLLVESFVFFVSTVEMLSRGSSFSAALSVSVTTVGAGVLVLPSAIQEAGILFVLSILLFDAFLTVLSIDYLVLCVDRLNLRSYEDISRELLGRFSEEVVRWVLITYTCGIAGGYIVVIGEIFTPMLPLIQQYLPFLNSPKHILTLVWFFIMLPLSCNPHINHIHFVSFLAVVATCVICTVIAFRYFDPIQPPPTDFRINYFSFSGKSLLTLPIMMFSFDCQALVFQVYVNLKKVERISMLKVSLLSVAITSAAYACVGIFGYLSFPGEIDGNILKSYNPLKDHVFAVGVGLYSITIIIAYCLVLFPCRDAVLILLFGYNAATHEDAHDAIPGKTNLIVSVTLSVISYILAVSASGIMFIIAVLGGICSSTICFIYPALFRLMMHFRGVERCSSLGLFSAFFMLVFGVFGGIIGTYRSLAINFFIGFN